MADISVEKVDEDMDTAARNDSKDLSESDERKEDTHDIYADDLEPNFVDGQLSYVGRDARFIPESLVQQYASETKRLDLSFNSISSTEGLESFTRLEELVLDNNEIQDGVSFPCLKKLSTLTLNKNKITDLEDLVRTLKSQLPSLTYLSLLGNTACPNQLSSTDNDEDDYQRYRYNVLYHLPNLKFLDSSAVRTEEVREAQRVGPYMKVVKPHTSQEIFEGEKQSPSSAYSPLPNSRRKDGQHIGTYGTCKYVYYGRHSEGNRFIRNSDL